MTLVIGRAFPDGPRLVADWRRTDPQLTNRPGFLGGALKVWLLEDDVAVAYAGNVSYAESVLRRARRAPGAELVERLTKASDDGDVEFLLGRLHSPSLVKVHGGSARETARDWIGDIEAFAAFQEQLSKTPQTSMPVELPSWLAEWSQMQQALEQLVRDGTAPSIGEMTISVVPNDGKLIYAPAAMLISGGPQSIPSGAWTTIQFGTAATGGFGYTLIPPKLSQPAMGLYFPHGRLGALYWPEKYEAAVAFSDVSLDQFVSEVLRVHGLELSPGITFG